MIERLLNERRPKYLASADVVVDAGAPTVVVVERICALRGEPIEKVKRKKPGNTSEKERPQKKRFRRRRRKKELLPEHRKKTLDKAPARRYDFNTAMQDR